MGKIYCLSGIRGFYREFQQRLYQMGNLHTVISGTDTLILLGNYIGCGPQSGQTLRLIQGLQQCYDSHFIVLRGDCEERLLDWLITYATPWTGRRNDWLNSDPDFQIFRTLITEEQWTLFQRTTPTLSEDQLNIIAVKMVLEHHPDLVDWLQQLPYYYETERQIFLRAGTNEEAGVCWKSCTPESAFIEKCPAASGAFHKDIIAGHADTCTLTGDRDFHGIVWDGANHYFCGGMAEDSGKIPVLVYDSDTGDYYSLGDDEPFMSRRRADQVRVRGELHPIEMCGSK